METDGFSDLTEPTVFMSFLEEMAKKLIRLLAIRCDGCPAQVVTI